MASVFTDCGFNIVSVASNHAMDWGGEALSRPTVEIRTRDGRVLSCTPDGVPGDPAHPVGWDLLEAKFRDCVSFARRPLIQGRADRMIELVQNLDSLEDVTEIIHLLG
jgi:Bacterial capsule synthesis protein PGA_cap